MVFCWRFDVYRMRFPGRGLRKAIQVTNWHKAPSMATSQSGCYGTWLCGLPRSPLNRIMLAFRETRVCPLRPWICRYATETKYIHIYTYR